MSITTDKTHFRGMIIHRCFFLLIILISGLSCRKHQDGQKSLHGNDVIIYSCVFDSCNEIAHAKGLNGVHLPDNLIILPGIYNIDGLEVNAANEGLLRILYVGQKNIQRIVFRNDTTALLSAISWIVTHGNTDKGKSDEDLNIKAMSGKLYLTCGPVSEWTLSTLRSLGINAREVMTLTLETWNDYDNGHNMIEIERNGRWQLFDLDNGVYFKRQEQVLDLVSFRNAVRDNDYEICSLSEDIPFQTDEDQRKTYDLTFYYEARFISTDNLRKWYKKVIDAILIEANDTMHLQNFSKNEINNRILKYSSKIILTDSSEFNKKFYKVNK